MLKLETENYDIILTEKQQNEHQISALSSGKLINTNILQVR